MRTNNKKLQSAIDWSLTSQILREILDYLGGLAQRLLEIYSTWLTRRKESERE